MVSMFDFHHSDQSSNPVGAIKYHIYHLSHDTSWGIPVFCLSFVSCIDYSHEKQY